MVQLTILKTKGLCQRFLQLGQQDRSTTPEDSTTTLAQAMSLQQQHVTSEFTSRLVGLQDANDA